MAMVHNINVALRLRGLVERRGCKPVARAISIAPQTIEAALRDEPLRGSTWEKIERKLDKILTTEVREKILTTEVRKKIAAIVTRRGGREDIFAAAGVSRSTVANLLAEKPIRSATIDKLATAIPIAERKAQKRSANHCSLCDRPSQREQCWRCCNKSSKQCQRCGHPHKNELSRAFCCLFVPENRGHCGWCGDDCERSFCKKSCSIAYHADRSNGLLGEGMTSESAEGAFQSSAWAP